MIEFEAPAGTRILGRQFLGIQTKDDLLWCYEQRKWVGYGELKGRGTNTAPCRSYKAFLRHIRKHPNLTQATLYSRYVGHAIHYTKEVKKDD